MSDAAGRGASAGAQHGMPKPPSLPTDSYTIAWICALYFEMAAAIAMLDEIHADLPSADKDRNNYTLGRIGQHNVVIACLPEGHYGTVNAARVVADLIRTFTSIRAGLMVGIGGGAPSRRNDVRLGDVVVGTRIMPYELGKVLPGGLMQHTAVHKVPDHLLCTLISKVRATDDEGKARMSTVFKERFATRPTFAHPDLPDLLFDADYHHDDDEAWEFLDCDACDKSRLVPRRERSSKNPEVHYGGIASGDKLRRDGPSRDEMAKALNVLCFEMETAGLMDILPCLPVRGICDYSDSHKHKGWQRYAAACAAAYARVLLETLGVDAVVRATRSDNFNAVPIDHSHRQAIMKSLEFDHVDSRKDAIKRTHARTCQWLIDNPTFRRWQGSQGLSDHHGFLWIRGKPGTGKSTLMKFLYERTKSASNGDDPEHLTASFFFHARGHTLEKSVAGMYRSLLLQLLKRFDDLQGVLDSVSSGQEKCPSVEVLKRLLEESIRTLGQRRLTCFIDALDEGDEQQITDMVRYFEDLAEQAIQHRIRLRICFSSRHYPYIDLRHGLRLILEDQLGHSDDLTSYIRSHLRLKCPVPVANLPDQLLERSCGVFLWVVLVVDILNKESYRGGFAIMKRLKEIPVDLKDLFADMVAKDQEDMYGLRLCIMWILFSKRPLTLLEFYHAMWSGMTAAGLAEDEPPNALSLDFDDGARFMVTSSSKGLAEVTTSFNPVVQFIHESVRDFLIKDQGLGDIWPDFGEARGHESLARFCSHYIDKIGPRVSSRWDIIKSYPLLDYSTTYVLDHAEAAAESLPQSDFLSSFPTKQWIMLDALVGKSHVYDFSKGTRLLYILTSRAMPNLIRLRLNQSLDSEGLGVEEFRYPLFVAVATRNPGAVAALLDASSSDLGELARFWASDGLEEFEASHYKTQTPLTWAAMSGFLRLSVLLIRRGADMKECDDDGITPLGAAIHGRKEPLIRLLLSDSETAEKVSSEEDLLVHTSRHDGIVMRIMKMVESGPWGYVDPMFSPTVLKEPEVTMALVDSGAALNRRDSSGNTPLSMAVVHGYEDTTRVLIQDGADPSSRVLDGRTPLSLAIFHGYQGIAKALIEAGADLNSLDIDRQAPLHIAVRNTHKHIVSWLVEQGADTNLQDIEGYTPLHFAVESGEEGTIRLLLDAGAHVNSESYDGQTPLSLAMAHHSNALAMVRVLVEAGAHVDRRGTDGRTPLHFAVMRGDEPTVKVEDTSDWTPLHEADTAYHPDDDVVKWLIRSGADTTATMRRRTTPLHPSSRHSHKVAEILIKHGAQVNARDDNGMTPLHLAAQRYMEAEPCTGPLQDDGPTGEANVTLLARFGADVNARDVNGVTPLHLAAEAGEERVVKALIAHGGDVKSRDKLGRIPRDMAARSVAYLLQ